MRAARSRRDLGIDGAILSGSVVLWLWSHFSTVFGSLMESLVDEDVLAYVEMA